MQATSTFPSQSNLQDGLHLQVLQKQGKKKRKKEKKKEISYPLCLIHTIQTKDKLP
jgi:hypothetical protein